MYGSKLMLVLGLTAFYLLFTLTITNDTFLDYDPASTFAAQLRRRALEGNGYGADNRYSKERVNAKFVPSEGRASQQSGFQTNTFWLLSAFLKLFVVLAVIFISIGLISVSPAAALFFMAITLSVSQFTDTRYNTDAIIRTFAPSSYEQPRFNPQPNYVYVQDNVPQLYSALILGPVVIVLSYILLDKLIK